MQLTTSRTLWAWCYEGANREHAGCRGTCWQLMGQVHTKGHLKTHKITGNWVVVAFMHTQIRTVHLDQHTNTHKCLSLTFPLRYADRDISGSFVLIPVSWSTPTIWHLPHWPATFWVITQGAHSFFRNPFLMHLKISSFISKCQLTANWVLPIIKCDQLSSSNGSTPVMTKLARKRLMTFCVSRSWSPSE